ncbi:MAG: cyclopropane-fatty-acyl-phospholipid synthase family protein [Gammaproteobacteria bacterium]|jgi:cyclopropane-fatty-acyl-phospholipid synthase|nr:cyclopropane-fatty-acyl-phospholipid synthase family protein [Gammaproteobacteria bacterium]
MNDFDDTFDTPAGSQAEGRASLAVRMARRAVLRQLGALRQGRLHIQDALGTTVVGETTGHPTIDVRVRISELSAWLDIASGGTIGAAEAYMAGKWQSNDLLSAMRLLVINREVMARLEIGVARVGSMLLRLAHWQHRNTRKGSRRNIHAHYDLGDELFSLFLDPSMMYSAAVFPHPEATLETASQHKLDLICRKLDLQPDDHLLEIGTGWGGLAIHAARHYGCRVTTTTISENQFGFARRRIQEAGLAGRITVLGQDYRDLQGQFDKLVSVEMIEAVGHRFMDQYFRICSERLKPAGRMLLQSITIADRYHEQAMHAVDFIQKYIFPGGALPSITSISTAVSRVTDLQLAHLHDIGLDYAQTLRIWRERFLDRLPEVRKLGYPDEFIRMWEWYLLYCEAGFRERAISTVQLVFDKPDCRLAAVSAQA